MNPQQIRELPTYSTWPNDRDIEKGSVEEQWYYFTKYYGYDQHLALDVEELDNEWGFGFVLTAHFKNSAEACRYFKVNGKHTQWGARGLPPSEENYIPIRWITVVGKKAENFLKHS